MAVFTIDPLRDARWQELVCRHPRSSVFQRVEWLRSLSETYGYKPVAYTVCEPGAALTQGVVFCEVRSFLTGNRLVSLPFSDHCEPLVETKAEAEEIFSKVKEGINAKEWKYMELRPLSSLPWEHILPKISSDYYLHAVDLDRSEDAIFKSFHKDSVQRKIRKAGRESLRYREGTSKTDLLQFYELMVQTRRRHHLPPQPFTWFQNLSRHFGEALKIRIAFKNHIPVASILTLTHNKTITYKYGCSDYRYNNLGGTQLLFWTTMVEARRVGFTDFDMGKTDVGNEGLVVFKERWGALRRMLSYRRSPEPNTVPEERRSAQWLMERLVPAIPDSALVAIGRFLYRHVG